MKTLDKRKYMNAKSSDVARFLITDLKTHLNKDVLSDVENLLNVMLNRATAEAGQKVMNHAIQHLVNNKHSQSEGIAFEEPEKETIKTKSLPMGYVVGRYARGEYFLYSEKFAQTSTTECVKVFAEESEAKRVALKVCADVISTSELLDCNGKVVKSSYWAKVIKHHESTRYEIYEVFDSHGERLPASRNTDCQSLQQSVYCKSTYDFEEVKRFAKACGTRSHNFGYVKMTFNYDDLQFEVDEGEGWVEDMFCMDQIWKD